MFMKFIVVIAGQCDWIRCMKSIVWMLGSPIMDRFCLVYNLFQYALHVGMLIVEGSMISFIDGILLGV